MSTVSAADQGAGIESGGRAGSDFCKTQYFTLNDGDDCEGSGGEGESDDDSCGMKGLSPVAKTRSGVVGTSASWAKEQCELEASKVSFQRVVQRQHQVEQSVCLLLQKLEDLPDRDLLSQGGAEAAAGASPRGRRQESFKLAAAKDCADFGGDADRPASGDGHVDVVDELDPKCRSDSQRKAAVARLIRAGVNVYPLGPEVAPEGPAAELTPSASFAASDAPVELPAVTLLEVQPDASACPERETLEASAFDELDKAMPTGELRPAVQPPAEAGEEAVLVEAFELEPQSSIPIASVSQAVAGDAGAGPLNSPSAMGGEREVKILAPSASEQAEKKTAEPLSAEALRAHGMLGSSQHVEPAERAWIPGASWAPLAPGEKAETSSLVSTSPGGSWAPESFASSSSLWHPMGSSSAAGGRERIDSKEARTPPCTPPESPMNQSKMQFGQSPADGSLLPKAGRTADADLWCGWSVQTTSDGRLYYWHASSGTSQWEMPRELSPVLGDWAEARSSAGEVYWVNKLLRISSWKDPRETTCATQAALDGNLYWLQLYAYAGGNLDAPDVEGRTALHYSCAGGSNPLTLYLLQNRAGTEVQDQSGSTPLHWACRYGHAQVVRLLLEAGARPDLCNSRGDTPLHEAAACGLADSLQWLVLARANPMLRNCESRTPADVAIERGMGPAALLLQRHAAHPCWHASGSMGHEEFLEAEEDDDELFAQRPATPRGTAAAGRHSRGSPSPRRRSMRSQPRRLDFSSESEEEEIISPAMKVVRAARPLLRGVQWLANRVLGERRVDLGRHNGFHYDADSGKWILQRPSWNDEDSDAETSGDDSLPPCTPRRARAGAEAANRGRHSASRSSAHSAAMRDKSPV
mmetsp:Transcript_96253/g.215468  ORF Transcript_96253/g.215468 Transcript_96253/m.215468 type:complete len:867 (-) Transcript_96253:55-2655(-)